MQKVPCPFRTWTFTVSCLRGWCLAIPLRRTRISEGLRPFIFIIMKKFFTLIVLCVFSLCTIHAEITWTLSDDGTLTISGTDMPDYASDNQPILPPWYSQRGYIKKVVIDNSLTYIGKRAFYGCFALTSVTIPNSVTSIGESAFSGCSKLTSITIPNSVTSIGSGAFRDCSELTSITIPNSVTSIESSTFHGCSRLTSVTIPNSVTSIGGSAFYGCSKLTSITIPNSVKKIDGYVFYGCSSLSSITIPNTVTEIVNHAFFGCHSLTTITIPSTVTWIGERAFCNCSGLISLTCQATVPPKCGNNCFQYVNIYTPVYVPASSIIAYQNKEQWKTFPYILPIPDNPNLDLNLTDNISDLTMGYYQKAEVTYTRNNMSVGDYATFCLPFDIDLSKTTNNFSKVYVPLNMGFLKPSGALLLLLDEVNRNSIIKAGQIFVVKCAKADVTFENCTAVMFDASTPNPTTSNVKIYNFDGISGALTQNTNVNLKIGGTFSELTNLNKSNYRALYANGSFDSTTSITPFQMYIYVEGKGSLGSKVTSISFDFNDEATDIKELRMTNDNSPVYDLNGRMVNEKNLKSGLYIKNGKKMVVK